jgi:hypothetical protein
MKDLEFWFNKASSFHIFGVVHRSECGEFTSRRGDIYIEKREQKDGSIKWAVISSQCALSKEDVDKYLKGNTEINNPYYCFVYEPRPSSRDDKFIEDTRFDTLDEAYNTFLKIKEEYKKEVLKSFTDLKNVEILE